uniref:Ig-like domain-containing protein n=1 Tax=Xiphophorus couchianus TaxID=32473 RepID=A0A3B5LIK5_9TELE
MAVGFVLLLSLLLPSPRPSLGVSPPCPAGCRCYSLTVECGSTDLRDIPRLIPPSTQVVPFSTCHRLLFISSVEPGSFRDQSQLLELALNGNRIHLLTPNMLQGLEQLRILYLSGNDITRLLDYTFQGLQRLQELHLQQNSIEMIADKALFGLTSLALLDLSRNNLHTIGPTSLQPLVSLQVLRITDNPWRCDCALHWLRRWIDEDGQRLLSSAERRLVCNEPPRLSHLSLVEVPLNSLVCIPPVVQLEPRRLAVHLGESLRVSCHASGYPRPQVTWKKASQSQVVDSPRGLVQDLGTAGEYFDPDTGSGMLFLSNVTVAHAGFYECEAWNAGGVARVTFQLAINSSTSSSIWASCPVLGSDVSREPLYALGSMAFSALGAATQTAIAVGISLLALTALLLVAMIYSRHHQRDKDADGPTGESILYVNDYSDGPTTFAQLEEYRDEQGHEMYVLNRAKLPLLTRSGTPDSPRTDPNNPEQDKAHNLKTVQP